MNVEKLFKIQNLNSGYDYECSCKRMFLTHDTFSQIWFPILITLGLYCQFDGRLDFRGHIA